MSARAPDLAAAARSALSCLGVGSADDILILCNPETRLIADALRDAAGGARSVHVKEYASLLRDGQEPPRSVARAMSEATVVLAPTVFSVSHTDARAAATERGVRMATMGGVNAEIFNRAIAVDYDALKRDSERIAGALTAAASCHVRSDAGTDLRLDLGGRSAISDDGDLKAPAAWGNLPAGEGFIAPIESAGDGVIVLDGSLAGHGVLDHPVELRLERGQVQRASGAAGRWLLETLDAGGPNGRSIAELGIGTNPSAIVSGNTLEDEKAVGTAHIAFGTSVSIGGQNDAGVHIDGVFRSPDIDLDGEPFLRLGKVVDASSGRCSSSREAEA